MKISFIIIVVHFIADFICQDEKWALGKSKNWSDLLSHTFTYSFVWLFPALIYCIYMKINPLYAVLFSFITFVSHTITDYFTSRVTNKLYAKGKFGSSIPNLGFFSMIGFDQVLHYAQLFLTFYFLNTIVW